MAKPPFAKGKDDKNKDQDNTKEKPDLKNKKPDAKDEKNPDGKQVDKDNQPADNGKVDEKGGKPGDKPAAKGAKKGKGPEDTTPVKVDFEPEIKAEELQYILDEDLSDADEYQDIISECAQELAVLGEDISIATRIKKRATMRRARSRIRIGRQRAMRRRATNQKIQKRARVSAISILKGRFAGGRDPNELSYSEKNRVERMVKRRKAVVGRLSRRLVRGKRDLERQRLNSSHEIAGTVISESDD